MVENRQIGGVLTFFETLGAKSTVNTDVFRALEAQNHGIYDVFASGNQNHGIYSVFWPVPSKNSYLRSFQHVARSTFSMPKAQKHSKLQCFGSALRVRGGDGGCPEMNSNRLNNQVTGLASLPFTS